MRRPTFGQLVTLPTLLTLTSLTWAQQATAPLAKIKAVGKEGAGNVEAAAAWKEVVRLGPAVLPELLFALDDAGPIPGNWLRAAAEQIRDDALVAKVALPVDKLEAFVRDIGHAGSSRRLAYELLVRVDPGAPDRLLPGMLDDPGAELRRDAVARLLSDAAALVKTKDPSAVAACKKALRHARDRDQVELAAKQLKALGIDVDLTAHFGFITHWLVAGPFDNSKGAGFSKNFGPESGVDPKAVYIGKGEKQVRWQPHTTTAKLGVVDFNKIYGEQKGVVGFAYAVVTSGTERPIELRAASNDAVRIYLNGKEIYFREEYHHGIGLDQHVGKGTLRIGRNEILVKVCQNEQSDDWARLWSFQLRVCDALGGAVPVTVLTR